MSNRQQLQDTLVDIQAEIDETIKLINHAISGGPRTLLGVTEQLKFAREATIAAELLIGVLPKGIISSQPAEIQRIRSGQLGSVARSSTPKKKCPFCEESPSNNELQRHIAQFHRQPLSVPSQPTPPASKKRQTQRPKAKAVAASRAAITRTEMQPTRGMTACPVCNVPVREDRLNRHLSKVHPLAMNLPAPIPSNNHATNVSKQAARKGTSVSARSQAYLPSLDNGNELSLEALDQSYRDRRDGGKELSQSRRDHGQFGSFPVHDDYSEDSYS
jgi:hypothetical protein